MNDKTKLVKTDYQKFKEQEINTVYNLIMKSSQDWRKPWSEIYQQNLKEDSYKGINQIILFNKALENNYQDPRWATFKSVKYTKDAKVIKGEKGTMIGFFSKEKLVLKKDDNGNPVLDKNEKKQYEKVLLKNPVFVKYYVFNGSQINGIEKYKLPTISEEEKNKLKTENYQKANVLISNFIKEHNIKKIDLPSDQAFYLNGGENKKIAMPKIEQFSNVDTYYSTLFHELGHSAKFATQKENEVNISNPFGSREYAIEELKAELTSLNLCKKYGIDSTPESTENSFSYLKSWMESGVLDKEDLKVAIIHAEKRTKIILKSENIKETVKLGNKEELNNLKTPKQKIQASLKA